MLLHSVDDADGLRFTQNSQPFIGSALGRVVWRGHNPLTSEAAGAVAATVGYSTTASYVSDLYLKWVSWKRNRRVEGSGENGAHGAVGDHKGLRDWTTENFDKAAMAKEGAQT